MKVVVTQPLPEEALARLRASGLDVQGPISDSPCSTSMLRSAVSGNGTGALLCQLTDSVDAGVIEAASGLQLISTVAAGVDNIDLAAAARHGVLVAHTPDVLTDATADLTLALILAVARRIPEGDAIVRGGRFTGWRLMQEPMGLDISGATLGIVGMGRIGRAVAQRAQAGFGMNLLYCGGTLAGSSLVGEAVALEELLARSDIVSLHAPLTPDSRHLLNARTLALMRPTAVLVNTGRGALVDERALVAALLDGVIAGAGLDVFEREPAVDSGLLELRERVVLTPHIGSATTRTRARMAAMAVEAVLDLAAGHRPKHVTNPPPQAN